MSYIIKKYTNELLKNNFEGGFNSKFLKNLEIESVLKCVHIARRFLTKK